MSYLGPTGPQPKKGLKKTGCTEATLWKWFSAFIRLRDSYDNGMCKCATCSSVFPWKEMDAGHFISRRWKAVKYDERNVLAQCPSCNRFNNGEQFKMSIAVDERFGAGTAKMLNDIHRCKTKFDSMWFKVKSDEYREKVKSLKSKKRQS